MKIKRYVEGDMRSAIRRVREEQGPDAVILSSRRIGNRIEMVAAVDYDESLVHQALRQSRPAPEQEPPPPAAEAEPAAPAATPAAAESAPVEPARVEWAQDPHIEEVKRELNSVRGLLEKQVGSLIWQDWRQRQPYRTAALKELASIGVSRNLAYAIARELPDPGPGETPPKALHLLREKVPVAKEDPIKRGGVIALVGPTGVGKTTTIAKLAARFTARHGLQDVALVTTDAHRVGAREQLLTYGQLLGVPVFTANTRAELDDVLGKLAERTLVLIDTAGMSPRDCRLASQFDVLAAAGGRLRTYLVLAANAHAADLERAVARFRATRLSGCVLTKLDESSRIGGALSMAIDHRLPIAYVADGQQVPEDLHRERPDQLILRALRAARGPASGPSSHTAEENMHACA